MFYHSDADLNFAALSSNVLIASGSAVHVVCNTILFVSMDHSKTRFIRPVGDERLHVLGEGVIHFALESVVHRPFWGGAQSRA